MLALQGTPITPFCPPSEPSETRIIQLGACFFGNSDILPNTRHTIPHHPILAYEMVWDECPN